jgi:hypothetical protein
VSSCRRRDTDRFREHHAAATQFVVGADNLEHAFVYGAPEFLTAGHHVVDDLFDVRQNGFS